MQSTTTHWIKLETNAEPCEKTKLWSCFWTTGTPLPDPCEGLTLKTSLKAIANQKYPEMTTPPKTLEKPVRFAIASPARWGRLLLDAAKTSPKLEFAGVWSRNPDNRADIVAAYGGSEYASLERLLADRSIEAVLLPTPHFLHHPQTMSALRAGKHVFVEKPMANTLSEAEDMRRASDAAGLVLAIGLQGRRTAGVRRAREILDSGEIGNVVMAVAVHAASIADSYAAGDWEIDPVKNPGGPLLNLGVHYMDVMQYLLGPIRRVSAFGSNHVNRLKVPDVVSMNLQFESGVPGVYMTNQVSVYSSRLSIHGTRGALHINRFGQELIVEEKADLPAAQSQGPEIRTIELDGPHPYTTALREELEEFAMCIRSGKRPTVGAREGILALRPVLAAIESEATGRMIGLPLERE